MSAKNPNQLRIIGGRFRGRKISFPNVEGIRPTPDRVRETLFNWLQPSIHNAVCLDLFCGSGALGLEALSRGADYVTFYDNEKCVISYLQKTLQQLSISNASVSKAHIPADLELAKDSVDIIFLDPPFRKELAKTCLNWLINSAFLKSNGLVYLETEKGLNIELDQNWKILKEKTAGQVCYCLLEFIN